MGVAAQSPESVCICAWTLMYACVDISGIHFVDSAYTIGRCVHLHDGAQPDS